MMTSAEWNEIIREAMAAKQRPAMPPAEMAGKTLALLREGGWVQGAAAHGSRRCMLTGVSDAVNGTTQTLANFDKVCVPVAKVILEQFPNRTQGQGMDRPGLVVVYFNDHPRTTFADVELVLEKVMAQ